MLMGAVVFGDGWKNKEARVVTALGKVLLAVLVRFSVELSVKYPDCFIFRLNSLGSSVLAGAFDRPRPTQNFGRKHQPPISHEQLNK
jgi:hypothetical protein